VAETGVTVHFMDEQFDTGDMVLQRPFPLRDGATHTEIETNLAKIGGNLLVESVQELAVGNVLRQPQPPGFSSDPWPTEADFELKIGWSARRAFNFMWGTSNWARPYFIQIEEQTVRLETAVAYKPANQQGQPIVWHEEGVSIQFSPGTLQAKLLAV
jgi:methionyl-tRNA formyltransferase